MSEQLPYPFVSPDVDMRDVPIPCDFLAELAVREFGLPLEAAKALVREAADQAEPQRRRPRVRRRR